MKKEVNLSLFAIMIKTTVLMYAKIIYTHVNNRYIELKKGRNSAI